MNDIFNDMEMYAIEEKVFKSYDKGNVNVFKDKDDLHDFLLDMEINGERIEDSDVLYNILKKFLNNISLERLNKNIIRYVEDYF